MNRLDKGKFEVLLRDDYLTDIQRFSGGRDLDSCIREAIEQYLALPKHVRDRETKRQQVRITSSAEAEPEYHMAARHILIPDQVVEKLKLEPHDIYGDLDRNLNAALRLWLQIRGGEELEKALEP
ncbi:MAG TPA: hypothetical protein VMC85_05930 [Desulfomonilaceae bacterium]|nr:hypothetical protein [Desulfomonilaceae bacterium]